MRLLSYLDSLSMVCHDDLRLLIVSTPVHRSISSPTEPFAAQARPKQAMHVTSCTTEAIV